MSEPTTLKSTERVMNNVEQYILTSNIDRAAELHTELERDIDDFKYYCFRQINGNGTRIINRLRGIDDLAVFYGIKTSTLSSLQPKIRIFKVNHSDFEKDAAGFIKQGTVKPLGSPCYREFKFSDNFGIETASSVDEYLKYETTKPSFRNVGLRSFMITQNGETHGVIENNIECKLEMSFKSLKDINASPPGEPSLRYVDLILWPPARFTKDTEKMNSANYEIKVVLGYSAPSDEQLRALNLSPSEERALKNIEKLDQIVSLGLYDYEINIQENGLVSLTASYRGRLETLMGSNQVNIFQDTIRLGETGEFELIQQGNAPYNMATFYDTAANLKAIGNGLRKSDCLSGECQEKKNLKSLIEEDEFFATMLGKTLSDLGVPAKKLGLKKRKPRSSESSDAAGIHTYEIRKIEYEDSKLFPWFKEPSNVEHMLNIMKQEVGKFREQLYHSFVDQLIDGNKTPGSEETDYLTRIFMGSVSGRGLDGLVSTGEEAAIGGSVSGVNEAGETTQGTPATDVVGLSGDELKGRVMSLGLATQTGAIDFSFRRASPGEATDAKKISAELRDRLKPEAQAEDATEEGEEASEDQKKKKPIKYSAPAYLIDTDFANLEFYYVYLGDIVELACKNARVAALKFADYGETHPKGDQKNKFFNIFHHKGYYTEDTLSKTANYQLNNARVLLGPLEYVGDDGETKVINLAKMPISLNAFKSWFVNKILRRRRSQMPLGAFLVSLLNDLVIPSLGVGMPTSRRAPGTKASIISLTLPGRVDSSKPTTKGCGGEEIPYFDEALSPQEQGRIIDTESPTFMEGYFRNASQPRSTISAVKTSYDYMLLYITSNKDIVERRGDPAVDVEEGIYHFNIGSDRGILRSMDFSRVSIPFMAELRSEQAEEQGVDQLEQLKFPYNTNVNLIGTSLFVPGMFYYINPSLAGLGSPENAASLAYQMNLGGYHLVQQVSTNISPGRYVTQIVGTQTAQGRR